MKDVNMLVSFFNNILLLSVMSIALISLICLAKLIFREKLPPSWHYYIWFLLLLRLIIPYTPTSDLSLFSSATDIFGLHNLSDSSIDGHIDDAYIKDKMYEDISKELWGINSNKSNENSHFNIATYEAGKENYDKQSGRKLSIAANNGNKAVSFGNVASIVWAAGALGLALYYLIISLFLKRGICKKPSSQEMFRIQAVLDECRVIANVKRDIPVVYQNHVKVPAIYGILKPRLLMPEGLLEQLDTYEIRYIILHELCHYKSKDTFTGLVQMFLLIVHWYNPFIWYAFAKMTEDRELFCDNKVLSLVHTGECKKYAKTLVKVLERTAYNNLPYSIAGLAHGRVKSMERRLKMIGFSKKRSILLNLCITIFIIIAGTTGILFINSSVKPANAVNAVNIEGNANNAGTINSKSVNSEEQAVAASNAIRGEILDRNGIKLVERTSNKTSYPYKNLAAHVIGLTNKDNTGWSGVEAAMNKKMAEGCSVKLTIDMNIQKITDRLLDKAIKDYKLKDGAAAIVIDPATGEVLAMVSKPDFDLNNPPSDEDIYKNPVFVNKAVADGVEPGAIFKAITAAAALEEGIVKPDDRVNDTPVTLGVWKIRCWKTQGSLHGEESFTEAMYNSCNPVFAKLSLKLGINKFYEYVRSFGFYSKTGVGLPEEKQGQIQAKPPTEIDMAVSSFGQRFQTNSIQLVSAYGAIANGGKLISPRIVKEITDARGIVIEKSKPEIVGNPISAVTSDTLKKMLEGTVSKGTAANAYVEGYRNAGITGTSQTTKADVFVASFAGFAPADNPKVACIIRMYNPRGESIFGGQITAPVAGQLLKEITDYLK